MRFTIKRLRALVLAAGVLLVMVLAAFLVADHWRNILNRRDIPRRLGINIQQEANGVTYTQSHGGHVVFKIHASRVEQMKNQQSLLHDVKIEFFAPDGRTLDSIAGNDFAYNQKTGIATAQGPAEITLTHPPAAQPGSSKAAAGSASGPTGVPIIPAAAPGTIHVDTSGLIFNQNTGVATTTQKVNFSMAQGSGTAMGAVYNSRQGFLVLDHAVKLTTKRNGETVVVHAKHARFERDPQVCLLRSATATYNGGQMTAGTATIFFRNGGSARRLAAAGGFTLATISGDRLAAPTGLLEFNKQNQPSSGSMQGGVRLDSKSANQQMNGTAPSAELRFSPQGELRVLQLNQGVAIRSEAVSLAAGPHSEPLRVNRTWRSPSAYLDFRNAGQGQVEPAVLHGSGGVVVTSETLRGHAAPLPMRLTAEDVTGEFGPNSQLTSITGVGHASMEQTTTQGATQTATGDRIVARFAPAAARSASGSAQATAAEIESAVLNGHVSLIQHPAPQAGAQPQAPMRATAGHAVYENAGQWLRLTENPLVEDGGMQIAATRIDVSEQSGQAFAHGQVKATWIGTGAPGSGSAAPVQGEKGLLFGGKTPAHVIAGEAQFSQSSGVAIFRDHARLWQQANSISAPEIILNREQQTVVARTSNRAEPVRAVLLGTGASAKALASPGEAHREAAAESSNPPIIHVRGGGLTYSDVEHRAVVVSGVMGSVVAETGGATCVAHKVVLLLKPRGASAGQASAEVESITATGDVSVSSQGRRGTGAKLVYSSQTGSYVLTGTPAHPPRLTDPLRGVVTGAALIFNSRNDSVSIEGRGRETRTNTIAPNAAKK